MTRSSPTEEQMLEDMVIWEHTVHRDRPASGSAA